MRASRIVLTLLVAAGMSASVLLAVTPVGSMMLRDDGVHVALIGVAVALTSVFGVFALRIHLLHGDLKTLALGAGLLGFSAIYIWHGVFTHFEPPIRFLIYGPPSRIVFAAAMLGVASSKVAPIARRAANVGFVAIGAVALAGVGYAVNDDIAVMGATSTETTLDLVRVILEVTALGFALIATVHLAAVARKKGETQWTLGGGLGLITIQSASFVASAPWTVMWWFAHAIGGLGTLLIVWGVLVVMREEVQHRELDRVRVMEATRTAFINTAAHELKTPLTPIKIQLHLLASSQNLTEKDRHAVDVLTRNINRLSALVDDVLVAARLQANRLGLHFATIDLAAVVREASENYQGAAKVAGIAFTCDAMEPLGVRGDAARLTQVVSNLISNAIKFTPPEGSVHVHAFRRGDWAHVEVIDTGVGFDPEDSQKLFLPFSQVGHERRSEGTGLGLFISKGIIEDHGGNKWAHSEGRGKGATFGFKIPIAVDDDAARHSADAADGGKR